MIAYLVVFAGAGIGGAMRHGVNVLCMNLFGPNYPFGTLTVNAVGSVVMGFLVGYLAFQGQAPQSLRLFLTTGVLGGFTTFSAFALDTALLWERGDVSGAALYVVVSVASAVLGLFASLACARMVFS